MTTPGGFLKSVSENKVSLLVADGVKVQMERFTGERDNFILWWNNWIYYKNLGKWDDSTSVLKLFTCLDGQALRHCQLLKVDDTLTVARIFETLKDRYLDDSMYETNYSLLVSAVQRDGQSVKKYEFYLNEKVDLINALAFGNASKQVSNELRLFHFIRGLHKNIKGHVCFCHACELPQRFGQKSSK